MGLEKRSVRSVIARVSPLTERTGHGIVAARKNHEIK